MRPYAPISAWRMMKGLIKGKRTNKGREQNNLNAALNNAKSQLLQLPLEVRRLVYEYVLGGNTIVLEYGQRRREYPTSTRKRWYSRHPKTYRSSEVGVEHHVCVCPFDEETSARYSVGWFWHCCQNHREAPGPKLDLGLLWTCRQIYFEAITVLYSQNTFRFQNTQDNVFSAFQRIVTSDLFLNNVTSLEAQHLFHHYSPPEAGYTAFCNTLSLLPNLHNLRLLLHSFPYETVPPPETWREWNRPPVSALDSQSQLEQRKCEWRELLLAPLRRIRTRRLEIWVSRSFGVVFREAEEWEGTVVKAVSELEDHAIEKPVPWEGG